MKNDEIKSFLKIIKTLGEGSFGNVFLGEIGVVRLAVKQGKTTKNSLKKPYSNEYTDWEEVNILNNIIRPIIEQKMCPNLPLMYKEFYCPTCDFKFGGKAKKSACIIGLVELASGGDLSNFLDQDTMPSEVDTYVALFHVLAGLHALQNYGVFHNDIKAVNILVYDIEPGGFYEYIVMGKRYYVPNIGKLFIINDFGVSLSHQPKYGYGTFQSSKSSKDPYNDFDKHTVIIHKNTVMPLLLRGIKNARSVTYKGYKGTITTQNFIVKNKKLQIGLHPGDYEMINYETDEYEPITASVLNNTDIIPPLDFPIDVLDVIYTFVGEYKRAGQDGMHPQTNISKKIKERLLKHSVMGASADKHKELGFHKETVLTNFKMLKPHHFLAKYLIAELFHGIFDKKVSGEIIETYKL